MDIESFAIGMKVGAKSGGGGSGGGVLVVHVSWESEVGTLDKTWQEIYTALSNDQTVLIKSVGENLVAFDYVVAAQLSGDYKVYSMTIGGFPSIACVAYQWTTNTATGYPVWTNPDP